jgi:hypothetical protein
MWRGDRAEPMADGRRTHAAETYTPSQRNSGSRPIRESRARRTKKYHRPWAACTLLSWVALIAFAWVPIIAAKTGNVSGIIFTVGAAKVQTVWPNARVTLKNLTTGVEVSTVSNDVGAYTFTGALAGEYEISVTLAEFEPLVERLTLKADDAIHLDFELVLKRQTQTVTVTAEASGVDLSSSLGGTPALTASILKSTVRLNQDFQDALPLLPGVVRGPDGLIRIKGGRTNQTNTLVNTASVSDPFTGQPALRLPAVAVQSVRVLSNPFSAEYGRFASGVVDLNTRGGTDEWKWLFEDPIPRLRWINGSTHGVESASPHLTFAGPIERGKFYLFQALLYAHDTVRVPSLPNPNNVRVVETVNTHTQLDWDASANHRFTVVLTLDPTDTNYANIDTFNPQPVTADYRQRGFFTSATHRWILANGGFVQSLFSAKRFDSRVFPVTAEAGEMVLFPEQNSGTYFEQQLRNTQLYQWSQALHLRPLQSAGRHLLSFGYSYARSTYQGSVANFPVTVLREDGTISSAISYNGSIPSQAGKNDFAFFVQDNWQIHPRLTLDLGIRLDSDSLAAETTDIAPRIGFVFAPTRDNRTAIRGGFGVFFDKIPINVAVFPDFPAQTITNYAANGTTGIVAGPATFTHLVATPDGQLRVPYSLGWTLQFDRELHPGLLFRFGYESRQVFREFYVNPLQSTSNNAELRLLNTGQQSYREFLWMLRWQATERTSIYASYVRSRAYGELNDYNQFFGNFPSPLIRQNQFGPLASDAPNRGLFWGVIGLPHKLDFVPILDVHTGFPFSRLDQNWNYIGRRNEAGRFPTFINLDTKLQYPVDFKFHGHHIQFRAGLSVYDVINHYNPRDVQQYYASPNYGTFYNSVGRLFRIDGDFDF